MFSFDAGQTDSRVAVTGTRSGRVEERDGDTHSEAFPNLVAESKRLLYTSVDIQMEPETSQRRYEHLIKT